jgi:hypothetical protein
VNSNFFKKKNQVSQHFPSQMTKPYLRIADYFQGAALSGGWGGDLFSLE